MESSVVIPVTFWHNPQPTFRVSSIRITPNGRNLVVSGYDGQLSLWDLSVAESRLRPRNVLIGHTDPITCLECTDEYVVSATEGGEMCRWNVSDGYCTKSVKTVYVHRRIQLFESSRMSDDLLFACGDYHEILVIHSVLLQTILALHSKAESDWISCFHVMSSLEIGQDVVSAMTKSGYIKLWILEDLSSEVTYEVQSTLLSVKNVSHIKCSSGQTQILVVSNKSWTVFDAKYLKTICSTSRICNEKFLGGDFLDLDILIWTSECRFQLYKLGVDGATLKMIFTHLNHVPSLFEPATCIHNSKTVKYLAQCDIAGNIAFWMVGGYADDSKPKFTCDLSNQFDNVQSRVFDKYMKEVTCCIVVSEHDLFAIGCSDGTIIVVSALESVLSYYFRKRDPDYKSLNGHKGRINCLLYPHEKYPYHNKSYLLSGGSDFSVCLWDLSSCRLIHRFCVQSGEIIKLIVPPEECKNRVRHSICSVAGDNSVAILNLKELKCIVLASRQTFPVVTINWRPLDDFIIIECFDGTVYIWEMETGHLDRVLHGVTAQEVIYACKESSHEDASNFCLPEYALVGKCHSQRGLFQIDDDFHARIRTESVVVAGFLGRHHAENQIVAFNLDRILERSGCLRTDSTYPESYRKVDAVVHSTSSTSFTGKKAMKIHMEDTLEARMKDIASCLQSLLLTTEIPVQYSVISESQNISVFMTDSRSPVLNTLTTVAVQALGFALDMPNNFDNPPVDLSLECLARLWQNKCHIVRDTSRKLLLSRLHSQTIPERLHLLKRWYKYLPHFPTIDGTRVNRSDPEIIDMQIIALVLFGVIGSEFKFKVNDSDVEERFLHETCQALNHLLQETPPRHRSELQSVATNLLGRGYIVWEQNLKFDKLFHFLFEMTNEYDKNSGEDGSDPALEKCLVAHDALVSMSIARTEAFITCLVREITQARNSQPQKPETVFMERSKPEMLLILTELLERSPYIMLQHLNDVVSILVYCVSVAHLKQEDITGLVPALSRFKQVHHSVGTNRIAVGLHDGGIVIHDVKTFKTHKIGGAHAEAVTAVTFSSDGKELATYSCFENRLVLWHVSVGIFGLGHFHVKAIKTFETGRIEDETIRSHMDIGELSWVDAKSVLLKLCDGSENVFHL